MSWIAEECHSRFALSSQYNPDFNPRFNYTEKPWAMPLTVSAMKSIWSCFNCQMCLERCNYNVKFPDFIYRLTHRSSQIRYSCAVQSRWLVTICYAYDGKPGPQAKTVGLAPEDIILNHQSDTRFFVGCAPYFDVIFKDIGVKTSKVFIGSLRTA